MSEKIIYRTQGSSALKAETLNNASIIAFDTLKQANQANKKNENFKTVITQKLLSDPLFGSINKIQAKQSNFSNATDKENRFFIRSTVATFVAILALIVIGG